MLTIADAWVHVSYQVTTCTGFGGGFEEGSSCVKSRLYGEKKAVVRRACSVYRI